MSLCRRIELLANDFVRNPLENEARQNRQTEPLFHHCHNGVVVPRGQSRLQYKSRLFIQGGHLAIVSMFERKKGFVAQRFQRDGIDLGKFMSFGQNNHEFVHLTRPHIKPRRAGHSHEPQVKTSFLEPSFYKGTPFDASSVSWEWVVMLGVVNTGIGCYLYFSSFEGLRAQEVALLGYLEPLSAVVCALAFLGEPMEPLQIIGGALIIAGAAFADVKAGGSPGKCK